MSRLILLLAAFCAALPCHAQVRGGAFQYEYVNTFTTRLFPGTPFNMTADPIDLPVVSTGVLTEVFGDQVGDSIPLEITRLSQQGALPGDPPAPFDIIGGVELTPELGPFAGELTEIVLDPSDPGFAAGEPSSVSSALRTIGGPFAQVLADGTFLYTVDAYTFQNTVPAIPTPDGFELIGRGLLEEQPDGTFTSSPVPVYVRLGTEIDPSTDPIIGEALTDGIVRITSSVRIPEPSTGALIVLVGLFASRCRSHR